jgi:integrase
MPKRKNALAAIEVRRLAGRPGRHAVGGVPGLHLRVTESLGASWILRVLIGSKRRDIGLGGFPAVSLAQARELAQAARSEIGQGVDPVEQKQAARRALIASQRATITFREATGRYLANKESEFKNPKHAQQWHNSLRDYADPVIGDLAVDDIELAHVVSILEPIWVAKTETASRVRGRIEAVLAWATVSGYRQGENPARWKGNLDAILAKPGKLKKTKHHRALDWREIGEFMGGLRERGGIAARCLEFIVLTGVRSSEARGGRWEEINWQEKTWTVPAERMKTSKAHVVPLCSAALALLSNMPRLAVNPDLIFPGARGGVLSDVAVTKTIRTLGKNVTVHGFRSSFRDWMAECTNEPHHVQEMALAHAISSSVERAYRRGDLLEKRRKLMDDWCQYTSRRA